MTSPDASPIIALAAQALPDAGSPPSEIMLLPPTPTIQPADGRAPWRIDDPQALADASMSGRDLVIDFDHQTDRVQRGGGGAPAAGWITGMTVRDGAIWGAVNWTPRGIEALSNRDYRFVSPVLLHDRSGRIHRIARAGLVNDPAIEVSRWDAPQIRSVNDSTSVKDDTRRPSVALLGDGSPDRGRPSRALSSCRDTATVRRSGEGDKTGVNSPAERLEVAATPSPENPPAALRTRSKPFEGASWRPARGCAPRRRRHALVFVRRPRLKIASGWKAFQGYAVRAVRHGHGMTTSDEIALYAAAAALDAPADGPPEWVRLLPPSPVAHPKFGAAVAFDAAAVAQASMASGRPLPIDFDSRHRSQQDPRRRRPGGGLDRRHEGGRRRDRRPGGGA